MSPEQPQHMTALERANAVRFAIAYQRREVARLPEYEGRHHCAAVLLDEDLDGQLWAAMRVDQLLSAIHYFGEMRVRRVCAHAGVMDMRRKLGALTARQRAALAHALTHPRELLAEGGGKVVAGETPAEPRPVPIKGQTTIDEQLRGVA